MLTYVILASALVAVSYCQLGYNTATTLAPTTSEIESEDEQRVGYRAPNLPTARRTNLLGTQLRQNAPSPQIRGIPQQESYKPYSFNYIAEGEEGTSSREETADGNGRVVGHYTLALEDGRRRRVEYVADADGFRANVDTNEPGTDSQSPADVVFYSSLAAAAAPAPPRRLGNPLNEEAQRPPTRTASRVPQSRPSAPLRSYVDSGHYHHQHSQPVYYDGSDYVVYRRPLPYYPQWQSHYH